MFGTIPNTHYHPFGMLMPQRYKEWNSSNCITSTKDVWVTVIDTYYIDMPHVDWATLGGTRFDPSDDYGHPIFDETNTLTGIYIQYTDDGLYGDFSSLEVGGNYDFVFDVQNVLGTNLQMQVVELLEDRTERILATKDIAGPDENLSINFTPTTRDVRVKVVRLDAEGSEVPYISIKNLKWYYYHQQLETQLVNICSGVNDLYRFGFNGMHKDNEIAGIGNHYNYPARDYDPRIVHWWSIDPLAKKFPNWSPYTYCLDNPILLQDRDGREPNRSQAGTVAGFVTFLNNTRSRMGTLTGAAAENAMLRLGTTEMNWKHMRPEPTTTAPFNNMADRYIYTEKGGWMDMAHFMFYAGRAYDYKMQKEAAQKQLDRIGNDPRATLARSVGLQEQAAMNPVSKAVQDGYGQEMTDRVAAKHSAYSYEDLPTDKMAADFGANYFDPKSKLTLGQQIGNYLNSRLGATNPESAPNYSTMPAEDSKNPPSRTNHTTTPVYTKQNP